MKTGSKLASDTLTDPEVADWVYNRLRETHEPSNGREMSQLFKTYGYRVVTERIAHIVKEDNRFKTKHLAARTDYAMLVFWA